MKIGILGLLSQQQQELTARFPSHDLRFLDKGHTSGYRVDQFAAGVDKVIVATRFIDHAATNKLPKSKTILVHGSVSRIASVIQSLPGKTTMLTPAPVAPHANAPAVVATVAGVALQEQSVVVLEVNEHGAYDYSLFRAGHEGDVFRFLRPTSLDYNSWYRRINTTRAYYRQHYQIETKTEFSPSSVDVTIVRYKEGKKLAKDSLAEAVSHTAQATLLVPTMSTETPATPADVLDETAFQLDREERALWAQVYAARASLADSARQCGKYADQAVVEFRNRYRPEEE